MEIFALIMMFCIFAGLQHLSNWLFRKSTNPNQDYLVMFGAITIVISVVCAAFIYDWSYEYKSKQVRDPSQYQMIASDSGYTFYDYERRVGFIPIGNSKLDTLIILDNQ